MSLSLSTVNVSVSHGGVIQARTVRRVTRQQRGDELSNRAFDNFIGSPRNLLGSKPSVEEQTARGEKWTWTLGCKGCMWTRRGYHHTKACDARKQSFLVAKARAAELRVTEAESWKAKTMIDVTQAGSD